MHRLPSYFLAALLCALSSMATATDVNIVGMFPGKVLVSINGGAPRTLAPGQKTPEGVTLVSSGGDSAVFDIDGKRRTLRLGEAYTVQPGAGGANDTVILTGDTQGHYYTLGAVNGRSAQFMVDTGASMVWLSSDLANRLGIPYRSGQPFTVSTAGGPKPAWRVTLASVRVGGITIEKVEGAVGEGAGTGETALLGMSFLSRVSMHRDGARLLLSRKDGASPVAAGDKRPRLVLQGQERGMFATSATVNGASLPFIVDTGATNVSIDAQMAQQIGIDFRRGTPIMTSTANGLVRAWQVRFDSVAVGPITLYNVEGSVREGPALGVGLLGMSFLNRIEMRREGEALTLIKRF